MEKYVEVVKSGICNYDGACQFGNHDEGFDFCYGEKFGTAECPLKNSKVLVSFKDGRIYDPLHCEWKDEEND